MNRDINLYGNPILKIERKKTGMKLTSMALLLVAAGMLFLAGIAIGRMTVNQQPTQREATTAPAVNIVPTADLTVPTFDVPGEDVPGLPRFPGMMRVEYRQVIVGDLLETEVEYVVEGSLEPVHDHFRRVFDEEGWNVADLQVFQGERTFFVVKDDREALVELESRGPLVEVEIELTEPVPDTAGTITEP